MSPCVERHHTDRPDLDVESSPAMLPPQLGRRLRRKLNVLRWWVRALLAAELFCWAVVAATFAFWMTYGLDRLFQVPVGVRAGLLVFFGASYVAILWLTWGRRVLRPLPWPQLALALERAYPQLGDLLVTAAEAISADGRARPHPEENLRKLFLRATIAQAECKMSKLSLGKVLRFGRVIRDSILAVMAAGILAAFAVAAAEETRAWLDRWILLRDVPWPVRTGLVVKGFYRGEEVIIRGQPFELRAAVDLSMPTVPRVIKARLADEHGFLRELWLAREAITPRRENFFQTFMLRLPEVLGPLQLSLMAGDRRIGQLRVRPKEPPSLKLAQAKYEPPAYLGIGPQVVPVAGAVRVPEASRVWFVVEFTEPVVKLDVSQGQRSICYGDPLWQQLRQVQENAEVVLEQFFQNASASQLATLQDQVVRQLRQLIDDAARKQAGRETKDKPALEAPARESPPIEAYLLDKLNEALGRAQDLRALLETWQPHRELPPWQLAEIIRSWLADWETICRGWAEESSASSFQHEVGQVVQPIRVAFAATDLFGLVGSRPIVLAAEPVVDEAPRVVAEVFGVGLAVTPQARVGLEGEVVDDHGIAKVKAIFHRLGHAGAEGDRPMTVELAKPDGPKARVEFNTWVELADLSLEPGTRCQVRVQANDCCDLRGSPQVGESLPWVLEIVSAEELRLRLEKREIALRQQLDQVIGELSDTRRQIEKFVSKHAGKTLDPVAGRLVIEPEDVSTPASEGEDSGRPRDWESAAPGSALQGNDQSRSWDWTPFARRTASQLQKNAEDVKTILEGVTLLRDEIQNNRLEAQAWVERLELQVIPPLREACRKTFPALQAKVRQMESGPEGIGTNGQRRASPPSSGSPEQWQFLGQVKSDVENLIHLLQMARAAMLELEDLRRVVELLREIIGEQNKLLERTQDVHRRRLRQLIEPPSTEDPSLP